VSTNEEKLLSGRMLVTKVFQDEVNAAVADTRRRLEPLIDADDAIPGVLPDGTRIGTTKRSKAPKKPTVTDMAAVLAWVKANRPEEVQTTESVTPAFLAYLMAQTKKHGVAVYEATGEIVPGVEMRTGTPSFLPQVDDDLVPLVRSRLAEFVAKGFIALPSADTDEAAS
jgi:hypothetical protein